MDLFNKENPIPLAEQLRPQTLQDIYGQTHLLSEKSGLRVMLDSNHISSFLLWGPPGVGKTTLARVIAKHSGLYFKQISAVLAGVADLRKIFDDAKQARKKGIGTLLFVDEIHRFNRSQQDSLLPYVEDGTVILGGATTENPGFEVNAALLSRLSVFILHRLDTDALQQILQRAEQIRDKILPLTDDARQRFLQMADGDARFLLNGADILFDSDTDNIAKNNINVDELQTILQQRVPLYDKAEDSHYNLISALHKSLRGSDCDAALYWMARMLDGGEDPLYLLRRLTRFAYEDIGMADPQASIQAINAWQTYQRLGSPEGDIAIGHLVVYLATAPKSNAAYMAHKAALRAAKQHGSLAPPQHILNAPNKFMKEIGYGEGYQYDHDAEDGFSGQNYFPEAMQRESYYQPVARGFERDVQKRLDYFRQLRQKKNCD
ncbi:MAG: replication-associated recombination protein A [Alphaproteobacteria bacterium]|nr:replication-associated recombination protein A [Alphaproteobacteria bacterium]